MNSLNSFKREIFSDKLDFDYLALQLFRYQAKENPVYKDYLDGLTIDPNDISDINKIPFLPIEFFKQHKVTTGTWVVDAVFESSGTSKQIPSKHYIEDLGFCEKVATSIFESTLGKLSEYQILALLPGYLERGNASLVTMVDTFMNKSGDESKRFFSHIDEGLYKELQLLLNKNEKKVLVIGVTHALLKMAGEIMIPVNGRLEIIETGGMKGQGKELIRQELHLELSNKFSLDHIYSEYGMTELTSQAYAINQGLFKAPRWMKIIIRELHDPFQFMGNGKTGGINVIDLANIASCAFIETKDLGKLHKDGRFEVLGRIDNSEIRGCNLMMV